MNASPATLVHGTSCVLIAALSVLGCGQSADPDKLSTVPAEGSLQIADIDDGELDGLKLSFIAEPGEGATTNCFAKVGPDGRFEICTYDPAGDGAPPGTYKAIVTGGLGMMSDDDARMEKIPAVYKSSEKTPWTIKVVEGEKNDFPLVAE